jgi:dTDP-4-dehydrorhamnose 3,5-epimerase
MQVTRRELPDVLVFDTERLHDDRGYLTELFNVRSLAERGVGTVFVQDNFSFSPRPFTVRGLHFQAPPHAQAKFVRILRGAALNVAVDLRRSSPTFGQHAATLLSAENWRAVYIPHGFAQGVLTLAPETELLFKLDAHRAPGHARGLRWDDPALGIDWPLAGQTAIVSEQDRAQPLLAELDSPFT